MPSTDNYRQQLESATDTNTQSRPRLGWSELGRNLVGAASKLRRSWVGAKVGAGWELGWSWVGAGSELGRNWVGAGKELDRNSNRTAVRLSNIKYSCVCSRQMFGLSNIV